jgi:hypothetical protein
MSRAVLCCAVLCCAVLCCAVLCCAVLYSCRWAGRDVAVKVIEHNTDTTVPVEREVTLMLSFNHPNVVRAFHFVTRVHTAEVRLSRNSNEDYGLCKTSSSGHTL